MMKRIPRIFHGPVNICGIGHDISAWQREKKNANAEFIVFTDNTNRQNSDRNLHFEKLGLLQRISGRIRLFSDAVRDYDIFHFYFGKSFFPLNLDLPILRLLGKYIIMDYVGSDVRLYNVQRKINPYYQLRAPSGLWDHFDLAKRARMVWQGIWAHYCFAGKILYKHAVTSIPKRKIINDIWINTTLDIPDQMPAAPSNQKPFILHAPSNRQTKGTAFVEQAVTDLHAEGLDFDFQIYQKVPHDQFIEALQTRADIVVDQLLSGGYGVLAMESMAYGKTVCGYVLPEVRATMPGLPIVQCTVDTLTDNLRELILDKAKRDRIGRESWEFARRNFDRDHIYEKLWQVYLNLWDPK